MESSLETKKLALLRIATILEQYSDADHPLTQEDILRHLKNDYSIVLERKAVGRNLSLLKEAGIEIDSTQRGSYLAERTFLDSELRLLIDGVLCSRHITARHSKDLIDRLCGMANCYFKPYVKHIHSVNDWNKTENQSLFYNIELIGAAIEEQKQMTFDFNRYQLDKKLHKTTTHQVSPYQMLIHNQRYYLMAFHERHQRVSYYRLDHITNMQITDERATPIRSVPGYENGIDYHRLSASLPYLFNDDPEQIEMIVDATVLDEVIEWFGNKVTIEDLGDGKLRVRLQSSPMAMRHWAMQYSNYVEIVAPQTLRDRLREDLTAALAKYEK